MTILSSWLTFHRDRFDILNSEYCVTESDMINANHVYRKERYSYTSRIYEINSKHNYKHVFIPSTHFIKKFQPS